MSTSSAGTVAALFAAVLLPGAASAGGREDYLRFCAPCHGARGDGRGPVADTLSPPPRDFTRGAYKFRSTPSGALPLDADILQVIEEGLRGTSMAGWRRVIPRPARLALVEEVKRFSTRFAREPVPPPIPLPPEPRRSAGDLARGRSVYVKMKCAECHGDGGRGDGPSAPTMVDDLGRFVPVSDLTRVDDVRRGSARDMMRVMLTGLDGTPMPSYAEAIRPDESWVMVRWIVSLQRPSPWWRVLFDRPLTWRGEPRPR